MLIHLVSSLLLASTFTEAYYNYPLLPRYTNSSSVATTTTSSGTTTSSDTPPPIVTTTTASDASTSSTSEIAGVTTNTVVTTTGPDGGPTTVPVLTGCSFCGGGDIILWGVPIVAGVYIIPGIAVPIIIAANGIPSEGSNGDPNDPTTTGTSTCSTTTVTDYWVLCADGESSTSCTTTSSSLVSGCSVTATTSTTSNEACASVDVSPNDDQGEDGGTAFTPTSTATTTSSDSTASSTTTSTPVSSSSSSSSFSSSSPTTSSTVPAATCTYQCDCPTGARGCPCGCFCSDGTFTPDRSRCTQNSLEQKKREEVVQVRQVVPKRAIRFGYIDGDIIKLRDASGRVINPRDTITLAARALTVDQAKCKGEKLLSKIGNGPQSGYTVEDAERVGWTFSIIEGWVPKYVIGTVMDQIPNVETDCQLIAADRGAAQYQNVMCKSGLLVAASNYKKPGDDPNNWSDVVWLAAQKFGYTINTIWRYDIQNADTLEVQKAIMGTQTTVELSISDDNGKAMLGTPNGGGVAWWVINHQSQYAGKTITSVTLQLIDGEYFAKFSIV